MIEPITACAASTPADQIGEHLLGIRRLVPNIRAGGREDLHVGFRAAANRQVGQLRAVAFEGRGFDRAGDVERLARIRVADADLAGRRLHGQRRLRKKPAWQRKEERGQRANDKPAAASLVVLSKHGCDLLIYWTHCKVLFPLKNALYRCSNR